MTLPLFAAFALFVALAFGIWLAGLNVRYRDVVYAVPFMTQALLFASPIGYPTGIIPDRYLLLYGLNPIAGLVEGFRWAASGANDFPGGRIPKHADRFQSEVACRVGQLPGFDRAHEAGRFGHHDDARMGGSCMGSECNVLRSGEAAQLRATVNQGSRGFADIRR